MCVGAFDDASAFELVGEIYVDEKPPGYAFAGDHPRQTGEQFLVPTEVWQEVFPLPYADAFQLAAQVDGFLLALERPGNKAEENALAAAEVDPRDLMLEIAVHLGADAVPL